MRAWIVCALCAGCGNSSPKLPTWDKTLPTSDAFGTWRGLQAARGIVHLHSPYSHDACDGMPRDAAGTPNEPCLDHLRKALCTTHIDYANLTDHDDTMADEEFMTLFNMRGTDTPVMKDGNQIASRIQCDDGHQVLVTIGGENELMPIMLDHHVPGTPAERHDIYNGSNATAITAMRDAGALIWVAHSEQHPHDQMVAVQPDGIEVYNLHANIDPKIRGPYLGLDEYGAITNAVEFADTNEGHPEPDLALLSFLEPNMPAITLWNQILADGRRIPATAGSDAHENALPVILADGERGDSYRRTLRWFSNIALVADPTDITQIEDALRRGRIFVVFEMMGTPVGFDVHAGSAELGDEATVGTTLTVSVPTVRNLDPSLPAPEIKATVWRITATGAEVVAMGPGPTVTAPMDQAGAYRVEISIVPHHLGPYLGDLGTAFADRELPWLYASPIYAR
jgi:hypothetical protein